MSYHSGGYDRHYCGLDLRADGCLHGLQYGSLPPPSSRYLYGSDDDDGDSLPRLTGLAPPPRDISIIGNNSTHDNNQGETDSPDVLRPAPEEGVEYETPRGRSTSRARAQRESSDGFWDWSRSSLFRNSGLPAPYPTYHPGVRNVTGTSQTARGITPATSDGNSASIPTLSRNTTLRARQNSLLPRNTSRSQATQTPRVQCPFHGLLPDSFPQGLEAQSAALTTQEAEWMDSADRDIESVQRQLQSLMILSSEEDSEAATPDPFNRENFPNTLVNNHNSNNQVNNRTLLPEPAPAAQGNHLFCTICQETIERAEMKTTLDECGHEFHQDCIYPWVVMNDNCPNCRAWISLIG